MRKSRVSAFVERRTAFELVVMLAIIVAIYVAFVSWASTWSTHTLALTAVVLLIFRPRSSK